MKLLVIGAGMYVTGRGTADPGTVLAALAQAACQLPLSEIVVATRDRGADDVERCRARLSALLPHVPPMRHALIDDVFASSRLSEEFAACIVSVPDHAHHAVGLRVLEAGLHCLMVKPLTPTLSEADALIAAQERAGLYAAVELHKRFDEANLAVRKLVRDGALGRLSYMTVEYSQRIKIPTQVFAGWSNQTNIFQYLGVHYVDLVYFLTGFHPVRALGYGTSGVLRERGFEGYDSVHALVEWQNPAEPQQRLLAQFATSWIDPNVSTAMSDQKFSLVGALGRVDCDQKNRGVTLISNAGVEALNPYFARMLSTMDGNRFNGYGQQSIERFVRDVAALRAGTVTVAELATRRPTFRDARPCTAVIEAVSASLAAGSRWKEIHAAF